MAIIKNGVNGTVSGKAGSVVFVQTKAGNYVRSLPRLKKGRKPTPGQQEYRAKFKLVQTLLTPVLPAIRIGFMQYDPLKKAHSNAMSYNLRMATIKVGNKYQIDWERFTISKGLPNPVNSFTIEKDTLQAHLKVTWEYDQMIEKKHDLRSYLCYLILYPNEIESNNSVHINDINYPLEHRKQTIALPKETKSTLYHIYLFFSARDGSNITTDSKYLGTITY